VSVGSRDFSGQDELQAGVQRLGNAGMSARGGILQDQDTPFRLCGTDSLAGLNHLLANLRVAPERRLRERPWFGGHQCVQHFPERGQPLWGDAFVVGAACVHYGGGVLAEHTFLCGLGTRAIILHIDVFANRIDSIIDIDEIDEPDQKAAIGFT
jgi:hypothetical protein